MFGQWESQPKATQGNEGRGESREGRAERGERVELEKGSVPLWPVHGGAHGQNGSACRACYQPEGPEMLQPL